MSMNSSDGSTINSWTYTGGDYHAPSSTVNTRINLWKFLQVPSQNVRVKISDFSFTNLLDTPDEVEVTKGTETSKIIVTWNAVPNAQYYGVYRYLHNDPLKAELLTGSWIEDFVYEDTDVQLGTIYYYFIRCSDNSSGSNISGYASSFSNGEAGWVTNYEMIDISVFLEGCFNGAIMNTGLNSAGALPLMQPYYSNPWNYTGIESVGSIPNINVVDWILMELRSSNGGPVSATYTTMIAQKAAFLLKTGKIKGLNGTDYPVFNIPVSENLFLVIYHRNHLPIISAYPMTETSNIFTYNFTNGADKAYGGALAHKQIATGIWGMMAGDGNANGQTENNDKNEVWFYQLNSSGYFNGDFDMNSQTEEADKTNLWEPNSGKGTKVPSDNPVLK